MAMVHSGKIKDRTFRTQEKRKEMGVGEGKETKEGGLLGLPLANLITL